MYSFTIPFDNTFPSYGVEWSHDSRHLFMGNVNLDGKIYEADLTQPDSASVIASLSLIAYTPGEVFGSLQMGPDGKIYLVRFNIYNLGVINNPDSLGLACDYSGNGVSTFPNGNWLGLPNYITSWFVLDEATGIGERNGNEIIIYPNPSAGNFTIRLPDNLAGEEVYLSITNLHGQKIFSFTEKILSPLFSKEISLLDISPGIYFFELKSANKFFTQRIEIIRP